jgi:hypothetical protein
MHRSNRALFLALVFGNLLPIFWFSHLPAADAPAHVYNATLFARYFFHPDDPAWRFVEFNTSWPPNMLAHGLLALFMGVMSPAWAERAFIALYAVALPLALRYALRGVSRDTQGIEFLGLFFVFNYHLHWGFYNFLAGLVAYLVVLGYWLRSVHREGLGAGPVRLRWAALLSVVLYFCHPVPLLAFWLTAGFLWCVRVARTRDLHLVELRRAAIVSLPAVGLYAHYALTRGGAFSVPTVWPTLRYAASTLVRLYPLRTYTLAESLAAQALSALLMGCVIWAVATKGLRHVVNDYLSTAALLATLVFLAPSQAAGGTLITARLVYFPLFLMLIWMVTVKWPANATWVFVAAGCGLAVVGQVSRWPIYQRYDNRMNTFLAQAAGREGQPVEYFEHASLGTPLSLDEQGTPHLPGGAWGYVAAERRNVLLDYEPKLGYFPFRYRAGADPTPYTLPMPSGCRLNGRLIDEARYQKETSLTIDTQMMWVDRDQPEDDRCVRALGLTVSAERRSVDGTLLWFDAGQ